MKRVEFHIQCVNCEPIFFISFKGFVLLYSSPLVCGGISTRGEGLHRSHGAGMVKNDIISIIFKGNKGQGNSCRSFGLPIRASFIFNFFLFFCCLGSRCLGL